MTQPDIKTFLPLSPAALHILAALAGGDRHGYGIMQDVAAQSEGQYKPGPATLYDNLQKLLDQRLVEEAPARKRSNEDPRRKYYRLTALGQTVLSAEINRLEQVVRAVKPHLQAPKPRRA